jgi:hypothetical protein
MWHHDSSGDLKCSGVGCICPTSVGEPFGRNHASALLSEKWVFHRNGKGQCNKRSAKDVSTDGRVWIERTDG